MNEAFERHLANSKFISKFERAMTDEDRIAICKEYLRAHGKDELPPMPPIQTVERRELIYKGPEDVKKLSVTHEIDEYRCLQDSQYLVDVRNSVLFSNLRNQLMKEVEKYISIDQLTNPEKQTRLVRATIYVVKL